MKRYNLKNERLFGYMDALFPLQIKKIYISHCRKFVYYIILTVFHWLIFSKVIYSVRQNQIHDALPRRHLIFKRPSSHSIVIRYEVRCITCARNLLTLLIRFWFRYDVISADSLVPRHEQNTFRLQCDVYERSMFYVNVGCVIQYTDASSLVIMGVHINND